MSEYKNGISPFKDPEFLKGSVPQRTARVTQQDKEEFARAFSDEKTRVNIKLPENKSSASPATEGKALYETPSTDIDAFIAGLTGKTAPRKSEQKKEEPEKTRSFDLSSSAKKKIHKIVPEPSSKELIEEVRVLSDSEESDRHIMAEQTAEAENTYVIDSLRPDKGEDIFDAVDKAVTKNSAASVRAISRAIESKNRQDKKQRDEKALLRARSLKNTLTGELKRTRLQLILCLAVFLLSLLLSLFPFAYTPGGVLEFMFSGGGRLYSALNIIMLLVLAAVFYKRLLSGIRGLIRLEPDRDCTPLLITLFVFAYDIFMLLTGSASDTSVKSYTCFAALSFMLISLTDYFRSRTALGNLVALTKSKQLKSILPVEDKRDAQLLAKGITEAGKLGILYCSAAEISDNLTDSIAPVPFRSRHYTVSCIATLSAGIILGGAVFILSRNPLWFMTVLLSVFFLCSPLIADTCDSILTYFEGYKLNKKGAAATDDKAIELVGRANGVCMDISDIFTAEVSSFRLMPGVFINKNDAAIAASAVMINAGTLIGDCFRDFIKQIKAELPLTENLQYEEGLGFSAWVAGRRVLVGSREMLIQHSIPAPDEREERHFAQNKFAMYVVFEGMLCAQFLVNYKALGSVKKLSSQFNKTGMVLMLTNNEPFLNHKEIAKRLSLETAAVKVLSKKGETVLSSLQSRGGNQAGGLVCSSSGNGPLSLVVNAHRLYSDKRFLSAVLLAGRALGLLLLILATVLNIASLYNPLTLIILQLLWAGLTYVLTLQRSRIL